jgi:hypothetical protein
MGTIFVFLSIAYAMVLQHLDLYVTIVAGIVTAMAITGFSRFVWILAWNELLRG